MVVELLLSIAVLAPPAFDRFPASVQATPHHATPKLSNARSRHYRAALRDAAAGRVDFAGHYVLASVGCGASCIEIAAIDRVTGRIIWFPSTVSNWPLVVSEPLSYRRDSRLLVIQGELAEKEPSATRRYVFDGRHFVPLAD